MIQSAFAFVYVIGPSAGPNKIGVAVDPRARRSQFQTGNPLLLHVHSAVRFPRDDAFKIEKIVRRQESHRRMLGDWFDLGAEDAISAVDRARSHYYTVVRVMKIAVSALQADIKSLGLTKREIMARLRIESSALESILRGREFCGCLELRARVEAIINERLASMAV